MIPEKNLKTRAEFRHFLLQRRKPKRGEQSFIHFPPKGEDENEIDYVERCYQLFGVRPIARGPLKMPQPNKPCPCGRKNDQGKRLKYKHCCAKEIS